MLFHRKSRLSAPLRAIALLGMVAAAQPGTTTSAAESGSEWRLFRDKEGHEVDARFVGMSPDCRTVKIARRDGTPIDLPIIRLSLDDQQHLREWFFARPPVDPATLRFRLTATRQDRSKSKEKLSNPIHEAVWETSELSYDLSVTNLSTGPVPNLRLEYCLLVEDVIDIRSPAEGAAAEDDAAPLWRANRPGELRYLHGTVDLPLLSFNRPHTLETGALIRDLVKTQRLVREESEDRPAGLIVRIVDSAGNLVARHQELNRQHAGMDWEIFAARRDPREKDGTGSLVEAVASN